MSDHEGPDGQDQRRPKPLKFYLSARLSRAPEMRLIAQIIEAMGHAVVSRWIHIEDTREANEGRWPTLMERDYADMQACDAVLFFAETERVGRMRGGRFVEFGWAFVLGKLICVIGPLENAMQAAPGVAYGCLSVEEAVDIARRRAAMAMEVRAQ